ncbi:MAG: YebC/PmpR family DNA-binding transcriptional regulator [Alcanivorax sp.]|jgi:YebC/PmpR family DNA-binding regulatory protein|uniref:YebC/PmpR family DNA-binding transcriptional regulator n=1 Tax=Alloalcanivorax TaxID=3020832 RepID=UPI000C8FFFA5|nr:YebC/PmpR family DNA-binding transcriptional regulator [Alcanivorax sp.]MED5602370.1 YebC/PmpR family DNA-binding transcriptional regulator [Pseudomonadota bacterium]SMO62417.1 DNA-binding regulatory protein, YebC/PmpR family [Alcanivorax sp. DSM 26295]MBD3651353.1 YebC/PmpR family DNA-binding transcriptional regulator [Alcanivorax sp.]MCH2550853.1 YebC/PmpR family DNA-binding transcriptional regulator [Alcanivorax sp.]|tara:strand:+ start:28183 stop:28914 length:732 start_codon:yes stop_codon:yes gene_type:complete
MAGHSKWANIKHRKAAQDAKRGKIFTKLIREITVAARMGGPEIADNPRLRAAVDKALSNNMTKDTIDRAIKRGAGDDDGANMEEITYEGYGKNGVAVLVETMTDNVNRTVSEVRHAFSKFGGNLGTSGSVAFLFTKRGEIFFEPGVEEEKLMEAALEAGAEDVEENEDGSFLVITRPDKSFGEVVDGLKEAGLEPADAEVTMSPSTEAEIDAETAETVGKMIDLLEDLDDVQNVYTNARWPEE